MIFLDSNIVIPLLGDAFAADDRLRDAIAQAVRGDRLVCNLIVIAEVAAGFGAGDDLLLDLDRLTIAIEDLTPAVALLAAQAHREYRRRGGPRSTMLPDFLIGAHAATLGATLMTRDRRLASYFPELTFLTPETEHG